jgi:hypothetical protein
VPSAYSEIFVSGETTECTSLINKTNNRGPRIEPWGTPDRTLASMDID